MINCFQSTLHSSTGTSHSRDGKTEHKTIEEPTEGRGTSRSTTLPLFFSITAGDGEAHLIRLQISNDSPDSTEADRGNHLQHLQLLHHSSVTYSITGYTPGDDLTHCSGREADAVIRHTQPASPVRQIYAAHLLPFACLDNHGMAI